MVPLRITRIFYSILFKDPMCNIGCVSKSQGGYVDNTQEEHSDEIEMEDLN